MTVEQLKIEAGKLPPDDRFALAQWIEHDEAVQGLRQAELLREIQRGLAEADRGELLEAEVVFARLRAAQSGGS